MNNDGNQIDKDFFRLTHTLVDDKKLASVLSFKGCVVSCVKNDNNTKKYYFRKEDRIDKIIDKYKHFELSVDAKRFIEHYEAFVKTHFEEGKY